jgi:hypothetical protein
MLTSLAGTGFSSTEAGVGPKKIAIAFPGGQYPISPALTLRVAVSSRGYSKGIEK